MSQTSYERNLTKAFPGMLADLSPRNDKLGFLSEEVESFPYGVAVVRGTDPVTQAKLPTAASALAGFAVHSHANEVGSDDLNLVDEKKSFNALHVGRIYVQLEASAGAGVTPASAVFIRTAAGSGTQLGAVRDDADTATALTATGVRFMSSAAPGEIVLIEVDPGASIA